MDLEEDGEPGAFADFRAKMDGGVGFAHEPVDDGEAESGAFVAGFGGEFFHEHFGEDFGGDAGAVVADGDGEERGAVEESFAVDEALAGGVGVLREVEGVGDGLAGDFDLVRGFDGLERVDGEVEQDLEEVRAVDFRGDVRIEIVNDELVAVRARVADEEVFQIGEHLPHADVGADGSVGVEEAEVAARDFKAAADLSREILEVGFDVFELLAFDAGGILHGAVDEFDEAADDGEGAVDVVENAGVDVAFCAGHFLLHALVLDLDLEMFELRLGGLRFESGLAAGGGLGDGCAHRLDVEWLVEVVAGPISQGLARSFEGFVSREHDDLDAWVDVLEFLEQFHAGHSVHHDVEDGDVDGLGAGDIECVGAIAGDADLVVLLEDDLEGLARAVLVIDDEKGWLCGGGGDRRFECHGGDWMLELADES